MAADGWHEYRNKSGDVKRCLQTSCGNDGLIVLYAVILLSLLVHTWPYAFFIMMMVAFPVVLGYGIRVRAFLYFGWELSS